MSARAPSRLRSARAAAWLARWSPLLPVLVAELVIVMGFGAVLPILPLYVVETGLDNAMLGLVIAAWPLAKLVTEPLFGYLADRWPRRPQMLVALVLLAAATLIPVWITTAPAFLVSRLIGGAAVGMYDPAARGIIVDATGENRRGEAFGLYGAFQMGGLILGPVLGATGAAIVGGFAFPFVLTAVLVLVSAVYLRMTLRDPRQPGGWLAPSQDGAAPVDGVGETGLQAVLGERPVSRLGELANRLLVSALVMQLALSFSTGVYEVIWSLYMERLGASVAWIGLTFTLFAVPVMVLSPVAGRLVDRMGGLRFAFAGGLVITVSGLVYTTASEPLLPTLVALVEASGFAFVSPALYWLLARGTPAGLASTAQGLFGVATTLGMIVSSLAAGILWDVDWRWPFYFFVIVSLLGMALAVLIVKDVDAGRLARDPTASPLPSEAG